MNYYKIIIDGIIVDVACNPTFVKQFKNINVTCNASEAMGIVSSDLQKTYHILGANKFTNRDYETVAVADITLNEYEELKAILGLGGQVNDSDMSTKWDEPKVEVDIKEENRNQTLAEAKTRKIAKLRDECQQTIFAGINVELSSGETKHFDLQLEDQLNFITLYDSIAAGETVVPYHASGEVCEYYTAEDMRTIISAAMEFKTYHTTYFNSLKTWVNAMEAVADVVAIKYGDIIPEEYQSAVFVDICNKRG